MAGDKGKKGIVKGRQTREEWDIERRKKKRTFSSHKSVTRQEGEEEDKRGASLSFPFSFPSCYLCPVPPPFLLRGWEGEERALFSFVVVLRTRMSKKRPFGLRHRSLKKYILLT